MSLFYSKLVSFKRFLFFEKLWYEITRTYSIK